MKPRKTIAKKQISDVFNALKRKGAPRVSLKKIKEIIEKGWAGQLKL